MAEEQHSLLEEDKTEAKNLNQTKTKDKTKENPGIMY